MEVSGQRNPWGRSPGTHWTGSWVGPRAGLDAVEWGKIFCSCRKSNTGRPACSSSLSRLSCPGSTYIMWRQVIRITLIRAADVQTEIETRTFRNVKCKSWPRRPIPAVEIPNRPPACSIDENNYQQEKRYTKCGISGRNVQLSCCDFYCEVNGSGCYADSDVSVLILHTGFPFLRSSEIYQVMVISDEWL
jgi:hypothetical protein